MYLCGRIIHISANNMTTLEYNLLNLKLLEEYVRIHPDLSIQELVRVLFSDDNPVSAYLYAIQRLYQTERNEDQVPYAEGTVYARLVNIVYDFSKQVYDEWGNYYIPGNDHQDYYWSSIDEKGKPKLEYLRREVFDELILPDEDTIETRYSLCDLTDDERHGFVYEDGVQSVLEEGFHRFALDHYNRADTKH